MRRKSFVRLLVSVLAVHGSWSYFVGLYKACLDQKGTICNRRDPQDDSSQPTSVTVRVSPIRHYRILEGSVLCTSNVGQDSKTDLQMHSSPYGNNSSRHSTVVPLPENVTSAIVEIHIDSRISVYLVEIPKFSRHSWLLQAVSITLHGSKGYISVSPPDNRIRRWNGVYGIIYSLTLVCHVYNKTALNPVDEEKSMKIVPLSPVTNCTSKDWEITLSYSQQSPTPIVFDMVSLVYSIVIDASLVTGSSNQVIGETSLTTSPFVNVDTNNREKTETYQTPSSEESKVNEFTNQTVSVGKLSGFTPTNAQTATDDTMSMVWGVVSTIVVLLTIIVVFIFLRLRLQKSSVQQRAATSDKHGDHKHGVISRIMSRFRSEYRTNHVPNLPPNGQLSNLLIPHLPTPADLHHIDHAENSQVLSSTIPTISNNVHDDSESHFAVSSCLLSQCNRYQYRHGHQTQSTKLHRSISTEFDNDIHENEDSPDMGLLVKNDKSQYTTRPQFILTSSVSHHQPRDTDVKQDSSLIVSSGGNSIHDGEVHECSEWCYMGRSVIEPHLFLDNLNPMLMRSECIKINQDYERLTGIVTESCNYPSYEDECFSLCESIVC